MESLRSASGASPSARRVTVDGVGLAVDDEGHGPAIVCLHAIGHGAGDFAALRARLAPRWRVIAPDWPGQGRSDSDRVPPSAVRYADLLAGLLDACAVERAVLLGNSIGGAAAIRYAAAHPERVAALVLENPGGLDPADDALGRTALAAMVAFFARRRAWCRLVPGGVRRLLPARPPACARGGPAAAHRRRRARDRAAAARCLDQLRQARGQPDVAAARDPLPGAGGLGDARPARPAATLPPCPGAAFPTSIWRPSPPATRRTSRRRRPSSVVLDRFLEPLREEPPLRQSHVV